MVPLHEIFSFFIQDSLLLLPSIVSYTMLVIKKTSFKMDMKIPQILLALRVV